MLQPILARQDFCMCTVFIKCLNNLLSPSEDLKISTK